MVVRWISHANRKKRRVAAARAKRNGIKIEVARGKATQDVARHIRILSSYLEVPTPENRQSVRQLTDYLVTPKDAEEPLVSRERVYHRSHRNFLSDDLEDQQLEMQLIAELAPGKLDPLEHLVISWQRGEKPTPEQIDEAVDILLRMTGLEEHQAFVVAHGDTDNIHCHVAVNRVHPVTGKRVSLGDDWGLEALHQATAVIEHRQGWKPQANAWYRANEKGVWDRHTGDRVRDEELLRCATPAQLKQARAERAKQESISTDARRFELRTGFMSAERYLKEVVWPQIEAAQDWFDLHWELAQLGAEYRLKGKNGAVIRLGDRELPASKASYKASLQQLQQGLGPFEPPGNVPLQAYVELELEARPAKVEAARRRALKARAAESAVSAHFVIEQLRRRHNSEQRRLNARKWKGRGQDLNNLRSFAGERYQRSKSPVEEARRLIKASASEGVELVEEWLLDEVVHGRRKRVPLAFLVGLGGGLNPVGKHEVSGFQLERVSKGEARYWRGKELAFVERPDIIEVHASRDDEAIRAALKLAQKKFGTVVMSGPPEFIERALRIAVEAEIDVGNPELRARYEQLLLEQASREVDRIKADAYSAPRPQPVVAAKADILDDFDPSIRRWVDLDPADTAARRSLAAQIMEQRTKKQVEALAADGLPFARELHDEGLEELAYRSLAQSIRARAAAWETQDAGILPSELLDIAEHLPRGAKPEGICSDSRLRALLGRDSGLLDATAVQARLQAAVWLRRGQRATSKRRKGATAPSPEVASAQALIDAIIAADKGQAPTAVVRMLADTVRQCPGLLEAQRALSEANHRRVFQLIRRPGEVYLPRQGAARRLAQLQAAKRRGY
jgi:hypothetical protein